MKQNVDDGLTDDDDEAEGDDGGVPHVYQFEVGRLGWGLIGGGEESRQSQLGREGYHDAIGEVVKLRKEAREYCLAARSRDWFVFLESGEYREPYMQTAKLTTSTLLERRYLSLAQEMKDQLTWK